VGKILQADGGTLFLDEIGDMPLHLQARLLRVLQERTVMPLGAGKIIPVDIEVICSTNRQLKDMIAQQTFREDLYYRLNGLVVKLPALRERSDLDTIVARILNAASAGHDVPYHLASEVMQLFRSHHWPGNFRQLYNLLRTAMLMVDSDGEIRREHLPEDFLEDLERQESGDVAATTNIAESERLLIQKALANHSGNVSAAARSLGISRNTIYRKLNTA
jgi:transcriptional regulator with PAS, ATPase and Fis domain